MRDPLRRKLALALAALGIAFVTVHHVIVPIILTNRSQVEQRTDNLRSSVDSITSSSGSSSSSDDNSEIFYQNAPLRYPSRSFTLPPGHWKDPSRWDGDENVDWEAYWKEKLSRGALQYFKEDLHPLVPALPGRSSCIHPLGPQPVILMGSGHTESIATFDILSRLVGDNSNIKPAPLLELTGSSLPKSIDFFQFLEKDEEVDEDLEADTRLVSGWMESFLCKQQEENPTSSLVGFQWKPYEQTMEMPGSKQVLERLANVVSNEHPQPVTIIRLKSNILDSYITHKQEQEESANKSNNGSNNNINKVTLETGTEDELYKTLKNMVLNEEAVDDWLTQHGVPYVTVEHEHLFYTNGDNDESKQKKAWKSLWKALASPSSSNKKMPSVETILENYFPKTLPKSLPSQRKALANYREVAKTLQGTDLEFLLRKDY